MVLSLEPWDDVWRRNQYLVDGLLRGDETLRVLFVEPSNDLLHSVVSGRGMQRGRGLRTAEGYGGRLRLFQPDKVLPRVAGPAADVLLRRDVRKAITRAGLVDPVLWVNDPGWAGLVVSSGWPSLYDMTDDWLAADRGQRELGRIAANEAVLMKLCDTVVVCSPGLYESRADEREVVLIQNAVDVARYRRPRERPGDLPERAALYVGTLHEDRLDVDLVLRTADAAASVSGAIVLVGPSALTAANVHRLAAHPAVRLLGPKPFTDVPAYLQHASVLMVPHVVDAFTDSLDPIKLYEYLAVGRPIVSTPVAGFRELDSAALTVADADAFPDAVAALLSEPTASVNAEGVPDWADRVAAYREVVTPLRAE